MRSFFWLAVDVFFFVVGGVWDFATPTPLSFSPLAVADRF